MILDGTCTTDDRKPPAAGSPPVPRRSEPTEHRQETPMTDPSPNFGNRAIREALELLRHASVTPEQYATVQVVEVWEINQQRYPSMTEAFHAARTMVADGGEVEVWRYYTWNDGATDGGWESWIIRPDTRFTQYGYPSTNL